MENIMKKYGLIKKIKFLFVGGSTFVLYVSMIFLLHSYLGVRHNIAITISYFLALVYHFSMNKMFVFASSQSEHIKIEMPKYIALTAGNYLLSIFLANIALYFSLSIYAGIFLSPLITMCITYMTMNHCIFRKPKA